MSKRKNSPNYLALWLLKKISRTRDFDFAAGDLTELFNGEAEKNGSRKARSWIWSEILNSLPRFIINSIYWRCAMFKNYFKIAFRNILRNKLSATINILGLTVGMACFILITLWVQDEISYDRFLEERENLHLLTIIHPNDVVDPNVPYALAPILAENFPEITEYTRIYELDNMMTCSFLYRTDSGSTIKFYETDVRLVDTGFFKMFSFPFIHGDPGSALQDPTSIVITDKIAMKYFGRENPLGKTLTFNNRQDLTVTGVISVPRNSHLQPSFISPLSDKMFDNWNWSDPSYILLDKNISLSEFKSKIAGSLNEYSPYPDANFKLDVMPINQVHLGFGRQIYVYIFSLIAVFILLIACINYMNLATACSTKRSREVGLRKVVGAKRGQIIQQFLGESVLLAAVGLSLSLVLVRAFLPAVNSLTSKQMSFNLLQNHWIYPFLFSLILVVGIIAGAYPALFLSASKPVDTLKTSLKHRAGRSLFRRISVVGQFAISILLIVCTLAVFNQLRFIQNRPLGISTDNVIRIPMNPTLINRFTSFRNKLVQNANILSVTAGQSAPFEEDYKTNGVEWDGKDPNFNPNIRYSIARPDYLETFGVEVKEGRSFAYGKPADWKTFVINEAAAKYMGMEEPVGQRLRFWQIEGTIIGVVKDFHHVSLHREIMPQIFTNYPAYYNRLRYAFVKVSPANMPDTIRYIQETSESYDPQYPFEYSFLDSGLAALYQSEQRLGKIFGYFAFLAIFISCLGIFGLASYTAERRTKEIGIRRILGSSLSGIIALLSKEFSRWVLLANLIAWPAGWFFMNKWLENFAYRTDMNILLFILAGSISLLIAAIPVGFQSLKAASSNPVDALRYE